MQVCENTVLHSAAQKRLGTASFSVKPLSNENEDAMYYSCAWEVDT